MIKTRNQVLNSNKIKLILVQKIAIHDFSFPKKPKNKQLKDGTLKIKCGIMSCTDAGLVICGAICSLRSGQLCLLLPSLMPIL